MAVVSAVARTSQNMDLIILGAFFGFIKFLIWSNTPRCRHNTEKQRDKEIVDWFTKF